MVLLESRIRGHTAVTRVLWKDLGGNGIREEMQLSLAREFGVNNLVFFFVPPLSLQSVLHIWPFAQKQESLKNRKCSLQYTKQKQKK